MLCDICSVREATGRSIRREAGKDVVTNYCSECRPLVATVI
jgi:hypothetical protein